MHRNRRPMKPTTSRFTPLEWRPQLAIGHDKIDSDHQRLIALINRVQSLFTSQASMGELTLALNELHDYTQTHFAREEAIMKSIGYPELTQHAQAHEALVHRLDELTEKILLAHARSATADALPKEKRDALLRLLREWLINHVIRIDRTIKDYLPPASAS